MKKCLNFKKNALINILSYKLYMTKQKSTEIKQRPNQRKSKQPRSKHKISNKQKRIQNKQSKKISKKENQIFTNKDFKSADGMLTSVWGPSMWHVLHTISFNYPVRPTLKEQKKYYNFVLSLKNILPCRYCRENLKNNLKMSKFGMDKMKNRTIFSKWMFNLHNLINKMLNKEITLTYNQVRNRYENFRSRCNLSNTSDEAEQKAQCKVEPTTTENGCTQPLYGVKSKCVVKIVPIDSNKNSFEMDPRCECKRLTH